MALGRNSLFELSVGVCVFFPEGGALEFLLQALLLLVVASECLSAVLASPKHISALSADFPSPAVLVMLAAVLVNLGRPSSCSCGGESRKAVLSDGEEG